MSNNYLTSLYNPIVKHLVKLRQDRDYRYEQQSIVIEGLKSIEENRPFIKKLFYTQSMGFCPMGAPEEWFVSDDVMKKISGMTSPEGILAEMKMPPFSSFAGVKYLMVLDGINDPGNLGTLLRTALALGWEGAFLLPNSCDPYNEKAIRAARGALFRLPLGKGNADDLSQVIQKNNLVPLVADLKGDPPSKVPKGKGVLLVLCNEAHGVSPEVEKLCKKIAIPMPGEMESLNVAIAGGILMYLLRNEER